MAAKGDDNRRLSIKEGLLMQEIEYYDAQTINVPMHGRDAFWIAKGMCTQSGTIPGSGSLYVVVAMQSQSFLENCFFLHSG